ncbi:MAG: dicarboxylate/amino acid:cation symporter, partial [Myxococcaceae bacterium]|nr:dicarboxylate/amino acid:cation symporter [Myxococcaceae bacterium]
MQNSTGLVQWWQKTPLYLRIVGSMLLGVAIGLALGSHAGPLAIPSKLVLRLLGALAPALVLLAIVQALVNAKLEPGTGKRLVRLLALNTLVAIFIGLLVANVVQPGRWSSALHPAAKTSAEQAKGQPDMLGQFLENVPRSLLGPLTDDGKVIGVIFLGIAFGLALRKSAHKPLTNVKDAIDIGLDALVAVLHFVIELVPLAVLGLVASIVGVQGFAPFAALGAFIVAVIVALLLHSAYYLTRIRLGSWVSPLALLKQTSDALLMAFSTGSSTVTMPLTYERLTRRVGLREESASLGALVGANFNNDGTALYEAMAALFVSQMIVAQGLGKELTLTQQLMVVLTSVVASVGAAGIPEAGLVTMTLVF